MAQLYQLRIELDYLKPPIWRMVEITDDHTLEDLHWLIQLVMPWENYHAWNFELSGQRMVAMNAEFRYEGNEPLAHTVYLRDVLTKQGDKIKYIYDMGDYWVHKITLKKISAINKKPKFPTCIKGKLACPVEDCGGPGGYAELVQTLANPKSPEHQEMLDWLGLDSANEFDPKYFSVEETNKLIKANWSKKPSHQSAGGANQEPTNQAMSDFQQLIMQQLSQLGVEDIEQLEKIVQQSQNLFNSAPVEEIDNLSPNDMEMILYHTFEKESPIGYHKKLSGQEVSQIPFVKYVWELLSILDREKELKLTAKGFLPRKICKELYNKKIILEEGIEKGYYNLNREADSLVIQAVKHLADFAGYTKKRKNKLSLTTAGKKAFANGLNPALFKKIFETNYQSFNLGFFDGYSDEIPIQYTFGYTLYLLLQYGVEERPFQFYVDKTLLAFPTHLEYFADADWSTPKEIFYSCYKVRIFERFLSYYGFIESSKETDPLSKSHKIKTTDLFRKTFEIRKENFQFTQSKNQA